MLLAFSVLLVMVLKIGNSYVSSSRTALNMFVDSTITEYFLTLHFVLMGHLNEAEILVVSVREYLVGLSCTNM